MNPNQPIDPQMLAMLLMQRPGSGAATGAPSAGAGAAAGGDPMMQMAGMPPSAQMPGGMPQQQQRPMGPMPMMNQFMR